MKADFYDKNFRKKDSNHTCLPVKGSDTVIKKKKKNDNYCPQVFLKVCKYTKKKVICHITQYINMFLATYMKNSLFL